MVVGFSREEIPKWIQGKAEIEFFLSIATLEEGIFVIYAKKVPVCVVFPNCVFKDVPPSVIFGNRVDVDIPLGISSYFHNIHKRTKATVLAGFNKPFGNKITIGIKFIDDRTYWRSSDIDISTWVHGYRTGTLEDEMSAW